MYWPLDLSKNHLQNTMTVGHPSVTQPVIVRATDPSPLHMEISSRLSHSWPPILSARVSKYPAPGTIIGHRQLLATSLRDGEVLTG
jgi:hypothetical protein